MSKKILIVEDEANVRAVTAFRLKKAGYDVHSVANGLEALGVSRETSYDLLLLDLLLPGIDGEEICRRLKVDKKLSSLPIILFTASIPDIAKRTLELGANDYLMKPFESSELVEKIKRLIG